MEDSDRVLESRGVIGNYVVERELGRGGMGVVYTAKHRVLGRPAAIKVLLANTIDHRDRVERFFNEARAAMAIDHPGVVKVYDVGIAADDRAYIAMELLDGVALAARLERGPLPLRQAVDYARQLADALAAAHDAGVIHRDLKPENILVCGERVVIVDFGIAKLQGPVNVRTATGALIGTPLYMAPEQCEGLRELDARTDLYALGCVMFAMLTGQPPFTGGGTGGIIGQHLHVPPPPLRTRCPQASEALERVVAVLLAKSPEGRFRTARAVSAALAAPEVTVLAGAPNVAATADFPAGGVHAPPAAASSTVPEPRPAWAPPPYVPAGQTTVDTVAPSPFHHPQLAATTPPPVAYTAPPPARSRRAIAIVLAACAGTAIVTVLLVRACGGAPAGSVEARADAGAIVEPPDATAVVATVPVDAEPVRLAELVRDAGVRDAGGRSVEIERRRVPPRDDGRLAGSGSARTPEPRPVTEQPRPELLPDAQPEPEPEQPKAPPPRVHETVLFGHGDFSSSSVPAAAIERVAAAHAADPSRKIILRAQAERDEPGVAERTAVARANAVLILLTSRRVPRSAIEIRALTIPASTTDGSNRRVDIDLVP